MAHKRMTKEWIPLTSSTSLAQAPDYAEQAKQALIQAFGDIDVDVLMLTPAFTTQSGPKCFAIQTVLK